MVGIISSVDITWANSRRWWGIGCLACCSPWGRKESDTTWWLNSDIFLYNPRDQFHQLLLSSVSPLLSTFPTPDPHVILGGNKESRVRVRDISDLLACDTCSRKSTWGLVYLGWWAKPPLIKWVCEQRPQEINEWGLQLLGVGNFWSGKDKVKGSRKESRRSVRLERKSERGCGGGTTLWTH